MKGKTHHLNHDLTFSAHTINCVCHSIRSMFKVLGIHNFDFWLLIGHKYESRVERCIDYIDNCSFDWDQFLLVEF